MISREEAKTRVAHGAALLDAKRPTWFDGIDVGTLTLDDCTDCVIGQLYDEEHRATGSRWGYPFGYGVRALGIDQEFGENAMIAAHGFGIGRDDGEDSFQVLQDAWIDAIADRRLSQETDSQRTDVAVGEALTEPVAVSARI